MVGETVGDGEVAGVRICVEVSAPLTVGETGNDDGTVGVDGNAVIAVAIGMSAVGVSVLLVAGETGNDDEPVGVDGGTVATLAGVKASDSVVASGGDVDVRHAANNNRVHSSIRLVLLTMPPSHYIVTRQDLRHAQEL
jgi:hypothetical protein